MHATASAASVSHFNLINTETGRIAQRLQNDTIVTIDHPFTIEAIPANKPTHSVRFLSPLAYRQTIPPYAIPGRRSENFRALTLLPQTFELTAWTDFNFDERLSITVTIRSKDGPTKGSVVSTDSKALVFTKGCETAPTIIGFRLIPPDAFDYRPFSVNVKVKHCPSARYKVKLISYNHPWYTAPTSRGYKKTFTMTSKTTSSSVVVLTPSRTRCNVRSIYIEACSLTSTGRKCSTSTFFTLPHEETPEPMQAYRPPYILELRPGDKAQLSIRATNSTQSTHGFTNGLNIFDHPNRQFALQATVSLKFGRRLFSSPISLNGKASLSILPGKGGVPASFDGAAFTARFSRTDQCRLGNAAQFEDERYVTQIIVKPWIPSLVKQDSKLPTIVKTPTYPLTRFGERVTMKVQALNSGGGKRAGGNKTALSYQWLVRTIDHFDYRTYADVIIGATEKEIVLGDAKCNKSCGSRSGSTGLHIYYVDVCNTFGCVRSGAILPNIIPPVLKKGEIWNMDTCSFEEYSTNCSGGQRYCVVDGAVQECDMI